jgi:rubrerythrin
MELDDLLGFAIEKEAQAADFYMDLASRVTRPNMRLAFQELAREERTHKLKLERIRENGTLSPEPRAVPDLRISDYITDVEPSLDMDYQQVLIVAMRREKASFRLYSDLAASTPDGQVRQALLALAQEEAKHKLRLEIEYDEYVLAES